MDEHDAIHEAVDHELTERLRALGRVPLEAGTATRALARASATRVPRMGRVRLHWVAAAAIAGFVAGGTGLAAAAVLPAPVQDTAHSLLSSLGVRVPPGHERYNDPTVCVGGPYRNHGAYVRAHKDDPNAGQSLCGKPLQAANGKDGKDGTKDKGNAEHGASSSHRHGPPPWAHAKAKAGHADNDNGNDTGKGNQNDNKNAVVPPVSPPETAPPTTSPSSTTTTLPETTTTALPETATTTTQP